MNTESSNNKPDNSIFLSQLPLHLQKILTIWNKLVYVGWVETTFTNLDKTLYKLISISEKNDLHDLYYQTLDIHRIFTDIINEKRTPSIYEFQKIDKRIKLLCSSLTHDVSHSNINESPNKIAILHINATDKGTHYIFKHKPYSKVVQCTEIESLIKLDASHKLDAILVYLEERHIYENALNSIKHANLKCKTIIAISPRTDAHIRLQAIRLKCLDFLQLPINEVQLSGIIESNKIVNEKITTVGLFKHAQNQETISKLMLEKNIHLVCSITPLDIIHDVSRSQAQVILLFDIDKKTLIEIINLLQTHPKTCLLPIICATSNDERSIQTQLNENAIHYLPNCMEKLDKLIQKTYTLGKHLIHQMQHNQSTDAIDNKILSTQDFISNFQYIHNHIERAQIKTNHYFFNININYISNNAPISHLGFSQIHKLSNITTNAMESCIMVNDIVCNFGDSHFFLIKESISQANAENEIRTLIKSLSSITIKSKPFDINLEINTVGVLIGNKHGLDALIDFTSNALENNTQDSTPIRIMNISNNINIQPINPQKNKVPLSNIKLTQQQEIKKSLANQDSKADVLAAFKQDGIFMKYQPIVDVQQNLAVFEAYARLCDYGDQCFDPSVFFPVLIQQGLAHEFNRKIIEKTLSELSAHNKVSHDADLILKLLPSNDSNEDILNKILPWFSNQLSGHRLLGKNRIIFELSEPWVIKHFEQAKNFTDKVKRLNCSICIDHSDLNDTTLAIANVLKPSYIKIEPGIKHLLIQKNNSEQLEILKQLTHNQTHIVASCVETAEEFSALWDKGIRYFQGYYVQQPMDQPEFLKTN